MFPFQPAWSVIEQMLQDFSALTQEIMMFYLCSVVPDVALLIGVPEDMQLRHAKGEVK